MLLFQPRIAKIKRKRPLNYSFDVCPGLPIPAHSGNSIAQKEPKVYPRNFHWGIFGKIP